MSGAIHVPAGERGAIRVFGLGMRPEQARFLHEPGALAQVLGIEEIDLAHVEIFPVSDLEEIGLFGYLTEGCGVPAEEVAPVRADLAALEGHVLLIRSRAFGGTETRLTPAAQIRLAGTFHERPADWSGTPPSAASAKPFPTPKLPPRQARAAARRIGAALFAVVMLLTALAVWLMVA